MRKQFSLFQTPIDLAHSYWRQILQGGETVIDATCGNGCDLLTLSELVLQETAGHVIGYDIQEEAIEKSWMLLRSKLKPSQFARIDLKQMSHVHLPFPPNSIKLIVYNLGYLPGGTKTLTTKKDTTLESLNKALPLITPGGALSITCYPGHDEGGEEEKLILEWSKKLSPKVWSVCYHQWVNRTLSPSLFLIQRESIALEERQDPSVQKAKVPV